MLLTPQLHVHSVTWLVHSVTWLIHSVTWLIHSVTRLIHSVTWHLNYMMGLRPMYRYDMECAVKMIHECVVKIAVVDDGYTTSTTPICCWHHNYILIDVLSHVWHLNYTTLGACTGMTCHIVPWLIHVCAMTHSCVCHDSFMCVPWLMSYRPTPSSSNTLTTPP